MMVHFIAGKSSIEKEIAYFRRIISLVKGAGHTLTNDWLNEVYKARKTIPNIKWTKIYHTNLDAIDKADIIIAEATTKSFGVGFQVALAIRSKKPVLLLVREEVDRRSMLWGIDEEAVQTKLYNAGTLDTIVLGFLKEFDITTKEKRFNLMLDRKLQNYLTWAAKSTGKTRSQIVRELIVSEMDKRQQ